MFGWQPEETFPGYLSVETRGEPGINTGIAKSEDGRTSTVATILVEDLNLAIASVENHGGTITVPRFSIPGVGYACYFTDINDMTVGMWEGDVDAE